MEYHSVSGIGLSQGKEIHPIPKGEGACSMNLHTIRHVRNGIAFYPTLKMFLVQPIFPTYFRKFLLTTPSAEMTEGYVDTLRFHIFFISRAKFSYFVIFSVPVSERLQVRGTAIFTTAVLFFLSMNIISDLLKSVVTVVIIIIIIIISQ